MLESCNRCGFALCDCPPPPIKQIEPPKTPPAPLITKQRETDVNKILDKLAKGEISKADAFQFYKETQKQMKIEIDLMKLLSMEVNEPRFKTNTMDDFPL